MIIIFVQVISMNCFYCTGKDKWESLGKKVSEADSLVYRDVPVNVLLLLKNYSKGVQERIFTYERKGQVWK